MPRGAPRPGGATALNALPQVIRVRVIFMIHLLLHRVVHDMNVAYVFVFVHCGICVHCKLHCLRFVRSH